MADNSTNRIENDLSSAGRSAVTFCFAVEGILGIPCALFSLRRNRRLTGNRGGVLNFYTSLAIADLGIAALCPITAYSSSIASEGWPFSDLACDLYGLLAILFGTVAIWSLLMSVLEDAYTARGTSFSTVPLRLVCLNALFWSAVPLLGWGRYTPERHFAGCLYDMDVYDSFNLCYMIGYTTFALFVPLGILFCSMKSCSKGLFFALTSLCICWSLYGVEQVWVIGVGNKDAIPIELVTSATIAAKLSPIVNFLIPLKTAHSVALQNTKVK